MSLEISAEDQFWATPELLEMLLPYLNAASTFNLAQAVFSSKKDSVVLGILQRSLVWNRLIERSLPFFLSPVFSIASYFPSMLEIKMNTVVFLAAILKMFKDPVPLEMDLLFFICKRFPPFVDQEQVDLSHHLPPHHFWTHSVSPEGFVLLEKVESALGITKQKIEFIVTVIDLTVNVRSSTLFGIFFFQQSVLNRTGSKDFLTKHFHNTGTDWQQVVRQSLGLNAGKMI